MTAGYKRMTGCPIAFSVAALGDKWTLLILREVLIKGRSRYDEFAAMDESIATNILASRLKDMSEQGLLDRRRDPNDGRRMSYLPTEKSIALLPVIVEMIAWSAQYDDETGMPPALRERFLTAAEKRKVLSEYRKSAKERMS